MEIITDAEQLSVCLSVAVTIFDLLVTDCVLFQGESFEFRLLL